MKTVMQIVVELLLVVSLVLAVFSPLLPLDCLPELVPFLWTMLDLPKDRTLETIAGEDNGGWSTYDDRAWLLNGMRLKTKGSVLKA
jgi:hypothetical protein